MTTLCWTDAACEHEKLKSLAFRCWPELHSNAKIVFLGLSQMPQVSLYESCYNTCTRTYGACVSFLPSLSLHYCYCYCYLMLATCTKSFMEYRI